jgi:hypothetical protein
VSNANMTTEPRIEISLSARASGFGYVRSDSVAVVSVLCERADDRTPLALLLRACVSKFGNLFREWLRLLSDHRILLFVVTPPSAYHNAVSRRRGVWTDDLQSLSRAGARSPSVEVCGVAGSRYAGLLQIDEPHFADAAEFVRANSSSFILVSATHDIDEKYVRSIAEQVFPLGQPALDWSRVVGHVDSGDDICIRVSGNFDDRQVSIDSFLSAQLLRHISRT